MESHSNVHCYLEKPTIIKKNRLEKIEMCYFSKNGNLALIILLISDSHDYMHAWFLVDLVHKKIKFLEADSLWDFQFVYLFGRKRPSELIKLFVDNFMVKAISMKIDSSLNISEPSLLQNLSHEKGNIDHNLEQILTRDFCALHNKRFDKHWKPKSSQFFFLIFSLDKPKLSFFEFLKDNNEKTMIKPIPPNDEIVLFWRKPQKETNYLVFKNLRKNKNYVLMKTKNNKLDFDIGDKWLVMPFKQNIFLVINLFSKKYRRKNFHVRLPDVDIVYNILDEYKNELDNAYFKLFRQSLFLANKSQVWKINLAHSRMELSMKINCADLNSILNPFTLNLVNSQYLQICKNIHYFNWFSSSQKLKAAQSKIDKADNDAALESKTPS